MYVVYDAYTRVSDSCVRSCYGRHICGRYHTLVRDKVRVHKQEEVCDTLVPDKGDENFDAEDLKKHICTCKKQKETTT